MLNWVKTFEILVKWVKNFFVFFIHGYHEKQNVSVEMGGFGKTGLQSSHLNNEVGLSERVLFANMNSKIGML